MSFALYYGTDSFRVKEAVEKKTASFLTKHKDGLVERLDFEKENSLEEVENIFKRRSFFNEPELIIVYACLSVKDLPKKNKKLFKLLTKKAEETKEFESIKGSALEKWTLEKITQAGFSIKLPTLKKLILRVVSQGQLSQEIDKLIAYQSYHGKKEIDDQAITKVIHPQGWTLRVDNFALIDAIGSRDIKKSVTLLNQTLADGTEPHAVLGQIIYQFRNLLKVKDASAADLAKIKKGLPAIIGTGYKIKNRPD